MNLVGCILTEASSGIQFGKASLVALLMNEN